MDLLLHNIVLLVQKEVAEKLNLENETLKKVIIKQKNLELEEAIIKL